MNMYYPKFLKRLLSSLIIGGQAINFIFRGKISKTDLFDQLMESGPGSLLIVLITGVAAGTVFNIQVASQLTSMGVSSEIGGLLAVGMAREMAPLLTATLMTGKVATAYAAQLGTMKVTEQIEAITMLRTEPVEYLVVPRLLSMVIMSPIQCLLFLSVALWSGQIWSTIFYKVPPIVFWTSVRSGSVSLTNSDLTSMIIKSVVFGLLISIIACGYGLTTKGGPKEVGTSTTGAVVMTLVTVSLMDVLLTQILFG
jgi:phospholipid/cholesterol/gamma-HCH transport system permease protein